MTLIVGIKCKNGIVVGADGAATMGSVGRSTVRQPLRKLYNVSNKIVVGVSGPVGLSQRFVGEITELWHKKQFSGKQPYQAMTLISQKIKEHLIPEIQAASVWKNLIGGSAAESAISNTLVAMPLEKKPCLFQFDHQAAPEEATEDLPFVALGIVQYIADPFLAFIRRIFWKENLPNVNDGVFATVWTLDHAILTNPGGVADPIQIMILEYDKGDSNARELSPEELHEHREAIKEAENNLLNFKKGMIESEVKDESQGPPEPPASINA